MNKEKLFTGYKDFLKLEVHDAMILQMDGVIKSSSDFINLLILLPCGSIYQLTFSQVFNVDLSINYHIKQGNTYIKKISFQPKDEKVRCEIKCHESEVTGYINILAKQCKFTLINSTQNQNFIIYELTKLLNDKADKETDKQIEKIFSQESKRLPKKIIIRQRQISKSE